MCRDFLGSTIVDEPLPLNFYEILILLCEPPDRFPDLRFDGLWINVLEENVVKVLDVNERIVACFRAFPYFCAIFTQRGHLNKP